VPEIQQVLPKYLQIANHIRDEILKGNLQPGDEIPSERQIAVDWNVARPTAAKSLQALRVQGLVESRQGAGTYVRDTKPPTRAKQRYSQARALGRIYSAGEYAEIKSAELVVAPPYVAQALGLEPGAQVVRRHRVTLNERTGPVETSVSWLDGTLASDAPQLLSTERIRRGTVAYIESITGRSAKYARDQVSARLATDGERRALELGDDACAVLVYRHTVYDANDHPLEFAEAAYPPDRWTFEQEYSVSD
jgi:GntR family transcriptional regulator